MWDYYSGTMAHFLSGIATRSEITKTYIYGFFKINTIFLWLHNQYPLLPAAGIIFNTIYISCYTILVNYILKHYKKNNSNKIPYLILLISYLLMQPSITQPSISGNVFLLATIVYIYAYETQSIYTFWQKLSLYTLLLSIYIFAFLVHVEPVIAASAITIGYLLLFHTLRLRQTAVLIPFIIVGIICVTIVTKSLQEVPFLYKMEQKLFYVGDGYNDGGLTQHLSQKDSIKYEALHTFFLSDEAELNEDFINKIYLLKKTIQFHQLINVREATKQAWQVAEETILDNWQYLFLFAILLCACFYKEKKYTKQLLFYSTCFFAVLFFLAYSIKLENRHYVLLSQVFIFSLLIFLVRNKTSTLLPKWAKYPAYLLLTTLLLIKILELNIQRKATLQTLQNIHQAVKETNSIAENKLLILDSYSISLFHGTPYTVRQLDKPKSILYYDFGQMVLLPEYRNYLNKTCKCNALNPIEFYNWLQSQYSNVIFVSCADRVQFLKAYMKIVHQKNINFKKVAGSKSIYKLIGEGQNLAYFQIEP